MKISVRNFKGFSQPIPFEINRLNVFTGANSGGKSSFIQLLLLIKQSLEARSMVSPLRLNNPYTKLGIFKDIINKQTKSNEFSIEFEIPTKELSPRLRRGLDHFILNEDSDRNKPFNLSFVNIKKVATEEFIANATLALTFKTNTQKRVVVKCFELKANFTAKKPPVLLLNLNLVRSNIYKVSSEVPGLAFQDFQELPVEERGEKFELNGQVQFISFFPEFFQNYDEYYDFGPLVSQIRLSLTKLFNRITYLGPLREEPKEFYYQQEDLVDLIGNKGENAAYILADKAKDEIECPIIPRFEDGKYAPEIVKIKFEDAVNYWMCEVFGMAESIKSERSKTNARIHTIKIKNKAGSIVPITHVGFGVSQIFPIVVEGLRAKQGSVIILEQPEIHLHPKVQSLLCDFSIALIAKGVSLIIETHSDHFINRLRRRVAESASNNLVSSIALMFVSSHDSGLKIESLDLNDFGSLSHWPEGFFDQYDDDLRGIIQAQAYKQKNK